MKIHLSSAIFNSAALLIGLTDNGIKATPDLSTSTTNALRFEVSNDDFYTYSPTMQRFYEQTRINGGRALYRKYNKNMNGHAKTRIREYEDFSESYDDSIIDANAIKGSHNQQYLKNMNMNMNGFDDLEKDYANQFLKRGLVMAGDFEGSNNYNPRFMETLKKFYASLLERPIPFLPDLSVEWKSSPGESVYRTPRLSAKFKSIDCANLAMRLRTVGIIYNGHRNRVLKLLDRGSKKLYAYKTYGNPDEFYAEREMFLFLDHPYFVKAVCYRIEPESGKPGIIFEYVEGMSSVEYSRQATPQQLQMISGQLFLAIEHLHWLGIVHADMKPENVLIKKDGTVQVIDLGFAIHLPQYRRKRGTHTTMAPELHSLVPGKCHEGIDWWAYGSTVAMWFGYNENYKNDDGKKFIPLDWQENQFVNGIVPWRFPQELRQFLQIFFQPDPDSRRLHTKRLLKRIRADPFFYGLDWGNLVNGIIN